LCSEAFLEYLKNTIHLREKHIYNYIGLCTAGNERVETYCLLIPPQLDCILPGSARYDQNHTLTYFEIDESKVGKAEIFRVKGFSRLVVTQPLNRIDFAGYECTRIENYFDYAGVRDRDYQERLSGQRLTAAFKEYERRVTATAQYAFKCGLASLVELRAARQEVAAGLRPIFAGYQGPPFPTADLSGRRLTFNCRMAEGKVILNNAVGFTKSEFPLNFLPQARAHLDTLPEVLKAAGQQIILETVLAALIQESRIFDIYSGIHGNGRFRLYCESDLLQTTNPPLIYDYQHPAQRSIPTMSDWRKFTWQDRDLREVDFSGQTLNNLQIAGANLAGAKFNGCSLNNTEFSGCDLTGAEFRQAKMQGARFCNNQLTKANFDYADLRDAEISGGYLIQAHFIKADLSRAKINNSDLLLAYFERSRLPNAIFTINEVLAQNIFCLCDLRNVRFTKAQNSDKKCIMIDCDFQNSDLSECRFEIDQIVQNKFIKAKLIASDFSPCQSISKSNFRDSVCHSINFEDVILYQNNFSKVDLSRMKTGIGTAFAENNLTYTNFSGYDFTGCGYEYANNLTKTNFSNCNLEAADFSASRVNLTIFDRANLDGAIFAEEQLAFVKLSSQQRNEIKLHDDNEYDAADEAKEENEETSDMNDEAETDLDNNAEDEEE
jgi:uncharacterized protein YjbI with pentapeptide repeats